MTSEGAAVPFGPESARAGFVTRDGDGEAVVALVESLVADGIPAAGGDDVWASLAGMPALARGSVWILPLTWEPPTMDAVTKGDAARLWTTIREACAYRYGWSIGIHLPPAPGTGPGYATYLAESGGFRAEWWSIGPKRAVACVLACTRRADLTEALALHLVPVDWLSERPGRRRPVKVPALDLSWTVDDIVRSREADSVRASQEKDA